MSRIVFQAVDFAYRPDQPVLTGLSLELPRGICFFVGPNGVGKSTTMLLAAARLVPSAGRVLIDGRDTVELQERTPEAQEERNRIVSVIYQNMELESDEPLARLFDVVAEAGRSSGVATTRDEVTAALELEDVADLRLHQLAKGQLQRALVAMSVLYGAPSVVMDEPLFAVEPDRAARILRYLADLADRGGRSLYLSVHDIALARAHADAVVLMAQDGSVAIGAPDELLTRERLEAAFRVPEGTLYERQNLYRRMLADGTGYRES